MEFLLLCLSFVEEMLSLLLSRPLSAPCQYFSNVVVVRYLLLLVLRLFQSYLIILNVSGVCSVGFFTVGASWFDATSMVYGACIAARRFAFSYHRRT